MNTEIVDSTSSVIPSAPSTPPTQGYAVNLPSAERMAVLSGLNGLAGYNAIKTILPEGTPLWDVGEQNLQREQVAMSKLPKLAAFADSFLRAEALREHRDVPFTITGLLMTTEGKVQRRQPNGSLGAAVAMTPTGLEQLVQLHREALDLPKNFAGALAWGLQSKAPEDRADAAQMFNQMVRRAAASKELSALKSERILRLAKRLDTGERYIYACTSKKHVGIAGGFAATVRRMAKELSAHDARVRVTHQGHDRLDVEVMFPMMNREIVVGDILWATIGLTLSESKDVSASIWDAVMRVLCANLTRAYYGKSTEWTRKHIGPENFVADMMTRLREGSVRIAPFVRAFGDAYSDALPEQCPTRSEVVARFEKKFPDAAKVLPGASIIDAWDVDGARSAGNTRGGFVNALTRASQDLGISDAQVVESAAGIITTDGWAPLF